MPKYLLSYHGGDFPPEEAERTGAAWTKWMDSLGSAAIDRGGPLDFNRTIIAGGQIIEDGGANPTTGYSVIEAENLDAAIAIAKQCPQIGPPHVNGTIEVSELLFT